jgi:hypothetical protein
MSATTLLRSTGLAGAKVARLANANKGRGQTVRAFAKAASAGGGGEHAHHPNNPPAQQQHKDVAVQKQQHAAAAAPAPAPRAWPGGMVARRPSSLLGSALFGGLDR